jgi:CrcB protein
MNRTIILIGIGGFAGSILRYLTVSFFSRSISSSFPAGTFVANVIGCLLVGLIYGLSERFSWLSPEWRFFLATGFCGGYTTFSAFAYEGMSMVKGSDYLTFFFYTTASLACGLAAAYIGQLLSKL